MTIAAQTHPAAEDSYHGVRVSDPYRWLENSADPQVRAWSREQTATARKWLDQQPVRSSLRETIGQIISKSSVSYGGFHERGGRWFASKSDPAKQQAVLVLLSSLDSNRRETVLVDPNAMDAKALLTIDWFVPSPDGRRVAVSMSKGGSESGDVQVYDTATGKPVYEVIPRVQGGTAGGSLAWTPDAKGFYYTRYPRGGERPASDYDFYQQVYYHQLGTPTESDRYELGKDAPRIAEFVVETNPEGLVLASLQNGDSGDFQHFLRGTNGEWKQITRYADRIVQIVFGPRNRLYAISRRDAPRGKLISLDLPNPNPESARVLVPQTDAALVSDFYYAPPLVATGTRIYATYQLGGPEEIRAFDPDGKPMAKPELPPVASVGGLRATQKGDLLFNSVSYLTPSQWRLHNSATGKTVTTALVTTAAVNFADCEVVREFAVSRDGTRVPVSILSRKGTKLDGKNPALVTAYGGFGVSLSPGFNPLLRPLLDRGFVYAIANLRGGGEFGQEWHDQGRLTRKQNVFDDFEAVLTHMVQRGYTSRGRLAIQGGSNGGLLMGATLTQHPDCCRAVVAAVGIYDMLRVELSPNGAFNTVEYGTVKEREDFRALYAYSPYHNVKDGTKYPSVLFLTGENDARVDPMHSRKMAARLQAASSSGEARPILLRTDPDAGHGSGKPLQARIEELADVYTFLVAELGVPAR